MDVWGRPLRAAEWQEVILRAEAGEFDEPIWNVDRGDSREFDAIFVGGGAGGRFGSAYLRARGGRQLTIDRWPFLGGSCPHQACVPHHLFSEAARELDLARWLSGRLWFGEFEDKRASILELVELFRSGRNSAHSFMNWQSKEQLGMEYILNASATVLDEHTVEVAGERFHARNLVLATGARTEYPDIPGIDLPGVYDFASLVEELDYEPSRCVIIGGSKVAIEYGSFFQATGCPTTIVSRSPLMRTKSLHHVDEDLRQFVVDGMRKRGMTILEGAHPVEIVGNGRATGVVVRLADGTVETLPADFVFIGTGERANSAPFVEALGVEVDERGFIVVNSRMQTSVPGVYAIGDLIGAPMEMFKARKCGMTAARNIMGEPYEFDFSEYPDFLHSTYEVTWVGLSEAEARERYQNVVVIQMPPPGVDPGEIPLPCAEGSMLYAFTHPELTGFQKCVIDADSRRIVGVHHVGYGAKDAFQYLDYLIRRGLTIDDMAEMNELFLNPEHFIQLCRLRAGQTQLTNL
ncbi:dihydrolipoamide dehydrogenase [Carbonactinospora thermoautotrophica]|uniref:Dihydrolipoamide dehydrogenase n=1 Tax=Carbonactinospora thermoautotrophica TaxID=1469144 RepID=A0A132MMP6_9ACTN|nr:NAD(P)/FAD-dependent oxidoreductase [Carbonactinospora thermoautotrophica]KWW99063.1 Dihydrolipoamide dehydrogenase [Carbonactinospora thermoautotrophica]KWX05116.1 dihydrolipoamide dehydrogenase [Carbonactinospora thermoautotrophica]KWX05826.1 dihydrolipoamide dehydrogenase [Carbonactinospora thermoautotrophica]